MLDHVVSFQLKYLHTLDVVHPAYLLVTQLVKTTVQAGWMTQGPGQRNTIR